MARHPWPCRRYCCDHSWCCWSYWSPPWAWCRHRTARQGRYHNTRFKALAEELGITVEHDTRLGWSHTTVPEATARRYRDEVERLGQALTAYRYSEYQALAGNPDPGDGEGTTGTSGGFGGRRSNNNGVSAACRCGRRIRLARSTYEQGPITCGLCRREFAE